MKMIRFCCAAVCCFLLLTRCAKEAIQTYECTGDTPTYTDDVRAIVNANCATSGCHNSTSEADGKDFSTYASLKSHAGDDSFLGSIQHLSGYDAMPEGGSKLAETQIQTIYCWIENGMPE